MVKKIYYEDDDITYHLSIEKDIERGVADFVITDIGPMLEKQTHTIRLTVDEIQDLITDLNLFVSQTEECIKQQF
jgi:hypothetical protein